MLNLAKTDVTDYRDLPIPVISRIECVVYSVPEIVNWVAKLTHYHMFECEVRGCDTPEMKQPIIEEVIEENVDVVLEMSSGLSESDREKLTARIYDEMERVRGEVAGEVQVALRRAKRLERDAEDRKRNEQSKADSGKSVEKTYNRSGMRRKSRKAKG